MESRNRSGREEVTLRYPLPDGKPRLKKSREEGSS